MTDFSDILIIGDVDNSDISSETKEIISGARKLADGFSEKLICFLWGETLGQAPQSAAAYGADTVLTAERADLKGSCGDILLETVSAMLNEKSYRAVLASKWHIDWLARLGIRNNVPAFPEIIELKPDTAGDQLTINRPVHGGKAIESVTGKKYPVLATIRSKAMEAAEPDSSKQAEITVVSAKMEASSKVEVLEVEKQKEEGIRLEDANIIVAGGRGIGAAEPFANDLKELAEVLGGVVGASRPPADDNWVDSHLHIGLTGKIVAPELYVAVGISGASQHMAGCTGSKTIVAINKDKDASIFKQADFGVVGKFEEVIPALTKRLGELAG